MSSAILITDKGKYSRQEFMNAGEINLKQIQNMCSRDPKQRITLDRLYLGEGDDQFMMWVDEDARWTGGEINALASRICFEVGFHVHPVGHAVFTGPLLPDGFSDMSVSAFRKIMSVVYEER